MRVVAAGMLARRPRPLRRIAARAVALRRWWVGLPQGARYYLVLVAIIAFAAFNTENNLVYLVGGLMVALLVVSALLARASLRGLRVTRALPAHLYAEDPVRIQVTLTNLKRRLGAFAVRVRDAIDGRATHESYLLALPPAAEDRAEYQHTFERRGLHTFESLTVHSAFPFGLFPQQRAFSEPQRVVVYPHIDPVEDALLATLADPHRFVHMRRGGGANIFGVREYRSDDDARHICWKLSAKSDRLLMREYETEQTTEAMLILDNSLPEATPENAARLEAAVRLTASLAWALVHAHLTVRLITRDGRGPAGTGQQHLYRMLYDLALIQPVVGPEHELPPLRVHDVTPATCAVVLADPTVSWVVGSRFPVILAPEDSPSILPRREPAEAGS